jgi:hypothetical protein
VTQQVMCIRKRGNHFNPHERIEGIGGNYPSQWYTIEETAIRNVERDPRSYYASVSGNSVWVVVAVHNGRNISRPKLIGTQRTTFYISLSVRGKSIIRRSKAIRLKRPC